MIVMLKLQLCMAWLVLIVYLLKPQINNHADVFCGVGDLSFHHHSYFVNANRDSFGKPDDLCMLARTFVANNVISTEISRAGLFIMTLYNES